MKKLAAGLLIAAFSARAAEPPPGYQRVRLRLLSDNPRVVLTDSEGRTLCKTPCNAQVPVDPGSTYRLEGRGILDSEAFSFAPGDTEVTLRVRAGSRGGLIAGLVMMGVGGGVASATLLFSQALADGDGRKPGFTSGFAAVIGLGAGIAVLGGIIALNNRSTTFTREPAP